MSTVVERSPSRTDDDDVKGSENPVPEEITTSESVRKDAVLKGTNFLLHPNVQSTPMEERIAFLEKKGLTSLEITLAIQDAKKSLPMINNSQQHGNSLINSALAFPSLATMVPWYYWMPSVAGLVGAGALLHYLWANNLENPEKEAKRIEKENAMLQKLEELGKTQGHIEEMLQQSTTEFSLASQQQRASFNESQQLKIKYDNLQKAVDDLKAEVRSLRVILGADVESFDSKNEPETEKSIEYWKQYDVMEDALRTLKKDNDSQVFKEGVVMLRMYVKNLVEHPSIPRYRRISTTNKNYKTKMEPLKGHLDLLKAIGFVEKQSSLECCNNDTVSLAVLKSCLKALEVAASDDDASLDDICSASRATMKTYVVSSKKPTNALPPASSEPVTDFNSFLSRLQPATNEAEMTTTLDEPEYPTKFHEVAKLIQDGSPVPGVEEIEDKLSVNADNPTPSDASPRKKPWEDEK